MNIPESILNLHANSNINHHHIQKSPNPKMFNNSINGAINEHQ